LCGILMFCLNCFRLKSGYHNKVTICGQVSPVILICLKILALASCNSSNLFWQDIFI
jgi:hypothetical protein